MSKSILLLTLVSLMTISCRKDKEIQEDPDSQCTEYEPTTNTYDELVLKESLDDILFERTWPNPGPHNEHYIDINCDGIADFHISGYGDQDWIGSGSSSEARLDFHCTNPDFSVFTKTVVDTSYHLSTTDTSGTHINSSSLSSSTYHPDATVTGTNIDTYVAGFDFGDTIRVNEAGWRKGVTLLQKQNKNENSWYFGPDNNGYTLDAYQGSIYNRGIIGSGQMLAIKYEGALGVKLGYVKFFATTSNSHANFTFEWLRMTR